MALRRPGHFSMFDSSSNTNRAGGSILPREPDALSNARSWHASWNVSSRRLTKMPALPATPPSRRGLDSTYTVSPRSTMRFGSISRGSEGLRFMRARTFGSARILNAFFTPNHSLPF